MTKLEELLASAQNALRQIERQLKAPAITSDMGFREGIDTLRAIDPEAVIEVTIHLEDNDVLYKVWKPGTHCICRGKTFGAAITAFRDAFTTQTQQLVALEKHLDEITQPAI